MTGKRPILARPVTAYYGVALCSGEPKIASAPRWRTRNIYLLECFRWSAINRLRFRTPNTGGWLWRRTRRVWDAFILRPVRGWNVVPSATDLETGGMHFMRIHGGLGSGRVQSRSVDFGFLENFAQRQPWFFGGAAGRTPSHGNHKLREDAPNAKGLIP